jgi:4-alpha-glucanotransferase
MLRLDHAMGLHRLYWVPAGGDARHGVYVQYRPDEMYAILNLESHRHKAVIVGENLGIVPGAVNSALNRHGIAKMYVMAIEFRKDAEQPFRPPAKATVASFGTHDLPTFASFWEGSDFEDRVRLGVLDTEREKIERPDREEMKGALLSYLRREGLLAGEELTGDVYRACLAALGRSRADRVMINLEDTWQETEPQNIPGTVAPDHPNWQRRARLSLEEIKTDRAVQSAFDAVREERPR